MSNWPIWSLLNTVFGAILEVFLLCIAGYLLARRGVLDKKTQRQINRLNVSLFTPSLLFSKVAFFLTPSKLKELWIIPIVFVVTTSVSMIVAYVFATTLRLKSSQRNFAMAASMFMNSNSLPIAIMQSLVYTVDALRWSEDDERNAMLGRALTYLVLYSTLGMMLRWSYGVHLLQRADEPPVIGATSEEHPLEPTESTPLISTDLAQPPDQSLRHPAPLVLTHDPKASLSSESLTTHEHHNPARPSRGFSGGPHAAAAPIHSFPNSPPEPLSASESDLTDSDDEPLLRTGTVRRPLRHRAWRISRRFLHKVSEFMTVPMWAALASLVVACIQPLQHTLDQHVRPIRDALAAAGNCSIPLTLVVLGAYFHTPNVEGEKLVEVVVVVDTPPPPPPPPPRTLRNRLSEQSLVRGVRRIFDLRAHGQGEEHHHHHHHPGDKKAGETKTVVVAVMSRMILTPMILLPLLTLLIGSDAQKLFDDPVFVVSNVLLITSAPALTLAQITQKASGDAFERLISRTIFWAYCVVTPLSTIISVVIGLLLAKL